MNESEISVYFENVCWIVDVMHKFKLIQQVEEKPNCVKCII